MGVHRRQAQAKSCAHCGAEFFPWRTTQRFCSKSCATSQPRPKARIDRSEPHRDRWGRACVSRRCLICGEEFLTPRHEVSRRKTCSVKCAAQLKKSRGGEHRKGTANPNYRSGKRVGVRDRANEERWYAALATACMAPDCPSGTGWLALHHICYRQHLRRSGGDEWDPRNGFTLCPSCHTSHHRRGRVLPVSCLPDAALEFAQEVFGGYAADYLRRYYVDDGDPRLADLEMELAA